MAEGFPVRLDEWDRDYRLDDTSLYFEVSEEGFESGIYAAAATKITRHWLRGSAAKRLPPHLRTRGDIEELFESLRDKWFIETQIYSSLADSVIHPAFQQIVGLGLEGIPHILNEMRSRPDPAWFWALRAIVGDDKAASVETVDQATSRWIEWGSEAGYL